VIFLGCAVMAAVRLRTPVAEAVAEPEAELVP
jgi:hypothetical protein